MSDKHRAIEQLYNSKEFNDCINKMEPDHLRDDLRAEVTLVLLEIPDEKFATIRNLKYYTARTIVQLIQSNTSPFYKKYRQPIANIYESMSPFEEGGPTMRPPFDPFSIPVKELNGRVFREMQEDKVKEYIKGLYWYDQGIINLYLKLGNYRAIEKETGIPWESCYCTVRKVIKKIRRDVLSAAQ